MLKFALPKMQPTNLLLLIVLFRGVVAQNVSTFVKTITPFKKCFYLREPIICLKERALEALNETILDDRPIVVGFLEIQKNPDYFINTTEEALPEEVRERSSKMSDILMSKLEEFFRSRTLKLNLSNAFEGRKGGGGGGGGKKGGMAMMAVVGMGAMMANMMMGKLALMAGSAMMMSKIALILCMVMIAKKMQEKGGGGEEKHIVYADSGHSHGGGGYGGGGWHRSLEDPHNLAYRGQWGTSSSENGSGKQRKPGKGEEKDNHSTVIGTTTKCSYSTTPPKRTEP